MVNKNVRKAIESLYKGRCDIYGYGVVTDTNSHLTENKEYIIYENISAANQLEPFSNILQDVKLFLSPEYEIKAGCKINVTQNGVTTAYKNSGQANIKSNHQEIQLELFEEWA